MLHICMYNSRRSTNIRQRPSSSHGLLWRTGFYIIIEHIHVNFHVLIELYIYMMKCIHMYVHDSTNIYIFRQYVYIYL